MNRRVLFSTLWVYALSPSIKLVAAETRLPTPSSLKTAGLAADKAHEPLILLASLPQCPYCELARRRYLIPYRHEQNLPIWQLDTTDSSRALVDFDGSTTTAQQWLTQRHVGVTPTVLFLDAQGKEIAPRLVGIASTYFYGAYLDERIALARKALSA